MKSLQLGESCSALPAVLSDTVAMGSNPSCDTSPRDHSCTAVPEPRHSWCVQPVRVHASERTDDLRPPAREQKKILN